VAALRHLLIISPLNTGRWATLIRALMVPGLLIWSCEIAEVSVTPGRAWANIWYSSAALRHAGAEQFGHPGVLVADQALDVFPFRMRRVGRRIERVEGDVAGAAGGADQEGRLDRGIGQLGGAAVGFDAGGCGLGRSLKPDQLAVPPLSACHLAASKRGLGNLRMPSAPVEVPNLRSQAEWR
jgi:hypothetical protein